MKLELRRFIRIPIPVQAALFAMAASLALAVPQPHPIGDLAAEKTQSPQFQVIGGDPNVEALPLKSTQVKASVSGVIAQVTVEQTYANTGKVPLEAIYVFPASTRAAVHGMEMRIGQRVIKAKIQEKEQAKATFQKAKTENKTASLLEQQRPNVFQMSVANIMPGDEVQVTLHYSEKLAATDRVYEFMFPTVVGPRYSNKNAGAETWVKNPYLAEKTETTATFALQMEVLAGMPLQSLASPSHQASKIAFVGRDRANVTLPASEEAGNRDFVLRYQLADQQVASGLLLHKDATENFFLLNVQPPARVKPEHIPLRDYCFIVDVSGSMSGFPLDTAKTLMRDLLSGLRETDTFNVLLFASSSATLSEKPLPATAGNIREAVNFLGKQGGFGGTELISALERALALPRAAGVSRSIVLVTDGFVDIEKKAFTLVKEKLNEANLFAFGIGSSVNRWLIEGLAHAGQGEPFVVLEPGEAAAKAKQFREYISAPVLTNIEVRYDGFATNAMQPLKVPDVFADRPIEIIGKWTGEPTGRITLTGRSGTAPYTAVFDVAAEAAKGTNNAALRPLWAREKVESLMEAAPISRENNEENREIATLGLTYNLLTEFTSFVAVDDTPREILAQVQEQLQTVQQPLPLPQGVSNQAVAPTQTAVVSTTSSTGKTSAVPEPGTFLLLAFTAASLLMARRRKW